MPRAVETATALGRPLEDTQLWSSLGILDTGVFHGLSVKFIQENMPEEFAQWESDPIHYRFPGKQYTNNM